MPIQAASNVLHLENQGITARVQLQSLPSSHPKPSLSTRTKRGPVETVRVLKGLNTALKPKELTPIDLIQGDPELDFSNAGKVLEPELLTTAYFDPTEPEPAPVAEFEFIDIVYDVDGNEKTRRPHLTRKCNLNDPLPIKLGKRIPLHQALTAFIFRQTYQLIHEDGVTMDFLYKIAQELHTQKVLALVGAGAKGTQPLILRDKGSPYRGFLYGEIGQGAHEGKYKLLLLLSAQEMKLREEEL